MERETAITHANVIFRHAALLGEFQHSLKSLKSNRYDAMRIPAKTIAAKYIPIFKEFGIRSVYAEYDPAQGLSKAQRELFKSVGVDQRGKKRGLKNLPVLLAWMVRNHADQATAFYQDASDHLRAAGELADAVVLESYSFQGVSPDDDGQHAQTPKSEIDGAPKQLGTSAQGASAAAEDTNHNKEASSDSEPRRKRRSSIWLWLGSVTTFPANLVTIAVGASLVSATLFPFFLNERTSRPNLTDAEVDSVGQSGGNIGDGADELVPPFESPGEAPLAADDGPVAREQSVEPVSDPTIMIDPQESEGDNVDGTDGSLGGEVTGGNAENAPGQSPALLRGGLVTSDTQGNDEHEPSEADPLWEDITEQQWSQWQLRSFYRIVQEVDLDSLQQAADAGNANAQTLLAIGHHAGFYSQHDHSQCVRLLRPACNSGQSRACALLANHYSRGYAVTASFEMANSLYARACSLGNATACHYQRNRSSDVISFEGIIESIGAWDAECRSGTEMSCSAIRRWYGVTWSAPGGRVLSTRDSMLDACANGNANACRAAEILARYGH
ncbi:tetratricopeptide repeat protein [Maricaulis sp. D1M11]|uniref:tetratricopeptide repeat protein n=1 Tax=Maricaulis sp. D1M11 TaxID=3076117 RepID=UPI0039B672DC